MELRKVEQVEDISPEDFHHYFVKPGKPVILKNYAKHWPAIEKWDYNFLRDVAGHHKVKLHGKWQDNEPTKIEMPPVKEVNFSEYIDMLQSGEKSDLRIFLFNLFKLEPQLLRDFDFPPIMEGYLKDFPYTFFGCAGSNVRLHYDIDLSNVFITQFCGTKRVTLFDQKETRYLYKLPFTTHSAVDLNNFDKEKFPAVDLARGYRCEINHGDTLFMPSGIWHYMEYLDASFSLSLRSLNPSSLGKLQGAYNVFVIRKLDEFISKFYKNTWSDYKLKKAIETANHILEARKLEKEHEEYKKTPVS